MERTAWYRLGCWSSPTLSQLFAWYSRTWSAKELYHWLWLAKPTLYRYNFPDCMHVNNHHLRSGVTLFILTPGHPDLASLNWSSSRIQRSWKWGEGSPFCGAREKNVNRWKSAGSVPSSSNNKRLQNMVWVGLTSDEGRAAQAWPNLFSGSLGSSSTKPCMLYLQLFAYGIKNILVGFWLLKSFGF